MVERSEDGKFHPYVMDFGLARETSGSDHSRSGLIEGTPRFMSPEQARGDIKHLDRRTDIYSLGITLYELLAGRSPYEAAGEIDVLLAVLTADPKPLRAVDPNIPIDLEAVTLKCIEKESAARYDSAKALADDLGRYLDGEPVQARRIGLTQRLYRRARRHKALVGLAAVCFASLLALVTYGVRTRLMAIERERQSKQQAELAQRLGQEVAKMEWLLRSARQLPLHDLGREKVIIRKRMAQLQTELSGYGSLGRGLAHYALGRGHLALHEYPEALTQLQTAIQHGNQSADVHYALGFVLGKQFEQAMYEARLSGGGDWAKKQLKEIEPQYLSPAIASLVRSREMKSDAPEYLEALIAYYQRDYELALKKSEVAQLEAPWLYEASKLRGDIHLERALQARDSGKNEEAEREFAAAIDTYGAAAAIGQSDAEVYEGLAEAWVRQIEMALRQGKPTEVAYAAAVVASDKITATEPQNIAGSLKRGFAALMTIGLTDSGLASTERIQQCLTQTAIAMDKAPGNPYASDVAADCNILAADGALAHGKDPEPLLRKALSLLEPAVQRTPNFLWGLNDLANAYRSLGIYFQVHGNASAKEVLEKSIKYWAMAVAIDSSYINPLENAPSSLALLTAGASTQQEQQSLMDRADDYFTRCIKLNDQSVQCYLNYFVFYAKTTQRLYVMGQDPQPQLGRALENLAIMHKLGGSYLDVEQHTALTHWVDAGVRLRRKQDPSAALQQLQAALGRCFALAAQDAMCRTLDAQGEWRASDWLAQQGKPTAPTLQRALDKARLATQSPETYPDAAQVLASTYYRLAQSPQPKPAVQTQNLTAGLTALEKVFAVNPNHALGRATQGALQLLSAQLLTDAALRRAAAQAAVTALDRAIKSDAALAYDYAALLAQAKELAATP